MRRHLPTSTLFNLLESDTFAELSARPSLLREKIQPGSVAVIDEIQKLPILLDEVQWLIEERGVNFLLTGSSARKLRRGASNLLGGRARSRHLLPLTSVELKEHFSLDRAINRGLLPSIYFSDDPEEDLKSYIGDYLSQEIAAEAAVKNLPAFSRFLHIAARFNARQVNYEKLAIDAQVAPSTVRSYFQILIDTLIGSVLLPWKSKGALREVSVPKFYFFDTGLARKLQGRNPMVVGTPEYGEALEALVYHELRSFIEYKCREGSVHFWRTQQGHEVDFILNDEIAIEVKASSSIAANDLKGLLTLKEEYRVNKLYVASLERSPRAVQGIRILPLQDFLDALWGGSL